MPTPHRLPSVRSHVSILPDRLTTPLLGPNAAELALRASRIHFVHAERGSKVTIINCAELGRADWRFLEDELAQIRQSVTWVFNNGDPVNRAERWVRRPNLSRLRACLQTALQARRSHEALILTHLPNTTAWAALFCRMVRSRAPHLAFSFNFTHLPVGYRKKLMRMAFSNVDRFVVFSNAERSLYSDYFGIPIERIDMLPWAMVAPEVGSDSPTYAHRYFASIGGEGRDWTTLINVATENSDLHFVVAARPRSELLSVPGNMIVHFNLPIQSCWSLLAHSEASVVPLLSDETNCGHITIVASQLLGKPVIATRSKGLEDYVTDGVTGFLVPAGDVEGLAAELRRVQTCGDLAETVAAAGLVKSSHENVIENWTRYLDSFLTEVFPSADAGTIEAAGRDGLATN